MTPARTLAKQWRLNPADRLRIEREIADAGRWSEFTRNRYGDLIAWKTEEDERRIVNSGGGAFVGTSDDRRFWAEMKDPAIVAASGFGLRAVPHEPHGYLITDDEDRRAA
jgi:hypothetical protein